MDSTRQVEDRTKNPRDNVLRNDVRQNFPIVPAGTIYEWMLIYCTVHWTQPLYSPLLRTVRLQGATSWRRLILWVLRFSSPFSSVALLLTWTKKDRNRVAIALLEPNVIYGCWCKDGEYLLFSIPSARVHCDRFRRRRYFRIERDRSLWSFLSSTPPESMVIARPIGMPYRTLHECMLIFDERRNCICPYFRIIRLQGVFKVLGASIFRTLFSNHPSTSRSKVFKCVAVCKSQCTVKESFLHYVLSWTLHYVDHEP